MLPLVDRHRGQSHAVVILAIFTTRRRLPGSSAPAQPHRLPGSGPQARLPPGVSRAVSPDFTKVGPKGQVLSRQCFAPPFPRRFHIHPRNHHGCERGEASGPTFSAGKSPARHRQGRMASSSGRHVLTTKCVRSTRGRKWGCVLVPGSAQDGVRSVKWPFSGRTPSILRQRIASCAGQSWSVG